MHFTSGFRYRTFSGLSICASLLLSSCGSLAPPSSQLTPPPNSNAPIAFVIVGENGAASARVIVPANAADTTCPMIAIDGIAQRMQVRTPPATIPQRATASDAANSKASEFPVLVCEFALPRAAIRADIGGVPLRLPKAAPQRIVLIGDSGCRMKKADNAWQACLDENEWPFRPIADAAAAMKPDLVIHVGDYHYRENVCPPEVAGCQGSPWGYGWDTWQADLFTPGAKLLAAAPWIVARGNHEECRRAGQGWFRFLDSRPFEAARSCDYAKDDATGNFTAPYAVPLAKDLQLIVFDSAVSGSRPLDPNTPRDAYAFKQYREQFLQVDEIAKAPGINSIFVNHHPILAYGVYDDGILNGGSRALLSVMKTLHPEAYYPASVKLALHGHVHLFEAISFSSNHPATILSGMAGDELSNVLPEPFPMEVGPAPGVVLEAITHGNQFGFVVMDKNQTDATWQISAFDVKGERKATCVLNGSKLRCDKTGLLK